MDALDIYSPDFECTKVAFTNDHFDFDIPAGGLHWSGLLAHDRNSLRGTLSQQVIDHLANGGSAARVETQPLNFLRQTSMVETAPPPLHYEPAIAPVSVDHMQEVLAADLKDALATGPLAPSTGGGVSIGVYQHGIRRIFSFGAAQPDSIYEVGSITRTFTGLLLAQMVQQKQVQLDEFVRLLLPPGTVPAPAGSEITLLDLAAQRSGLPPMPDNISVANMANPYADYHSADLLAYLRKRGLGNDAHEVSDFGSLGFGLLGVALASRTGTPYAELVKSEITSPLGMSDTAVSLTAEQDARMAAGHDQWHAPAKPWDRTCLRALLHSARRLAICSRTWLPACIRNRCIRTPAHLQRRHCPRP